MREVKKAVFPVAGLGTRFRPVTKALPKEMLPVVDKPLIDYAIEEALESGITDFMFVISPHKEIIVNYLMDTKELKPVLGDGDCGDNVRTYKSQSSPSLKISFVVQKEPLGLGDAILCARHWVKESVFAVILPDDLIISTVPCLTQMLSNYKTSGGNVIGVMEVKPDHAHMYGVLEAEEQAGQLVRVKGMVEKPPPGEAPSNLAIIGRYVLQPDIFDLLSNQVPGVAGEVQLTGAMHEMLEFQEFFGFRFQGTRFDCGNKSGLVEANIAYSLKRTDVNLQIKRVLELFRAYSPEDGVRK